jgi:nitroimidazol reductase NimA-like FMN-containing flavoprotein (pyridoxamine 5'-phosphate oxidase superfamily)
MRRKKKEIRDRAVIDRLLNTCPVGRLGTIGKDGYPRIKPLNFVYLDGAIYFHSAKEGEKIDDIGRDNRVVFEVDETIGYAKGDINPCSARYLYQSVIIKGKAVIVADDGERLLALKSLMEKYQPEGGYGAFLPEKLAITAIVRIDAEERTGKEDIVQE